MPQRVAAMYRYPIKGLSPQAIGRAELVAGQFFPGDRLFALENGPTDFDEAKPFHRPKIHYLTLMKNAALAKLVTHYEDASHLLTVRQDGGERRFDLQTAAGRAALEAFLAGFLPREEVRGPLRLLEGRDGFRFTDSKKGFVSIANLASIKAIEPLVGKPVDPLRMRANLYVEGWPAWAELDLVGRDLAFATGVRLRVVKRTERCAATNVDPTTGERDLMLPAMLLQRLNHADCGIYCEVVRGGRLEAGASFAVEDAAN